VDLSADELRRRLWAATTGDEPGLAAICQAHRALIVQHFPQWCTQPAEIRSRPVRAEGSAQPMIAIVRIFQQRLGSSGC